MKSLIVAMCCFVTSGAFAAHVVYVEATASSDIGEHIAITQANARAQSRARRKCAVAGFKIEPTKVKGSNWTTARYRNRLWVAKVFGDYDCEGGKEEETVVHGPWSSENGTMKFVLLGERLSWWQSVQACEELGYKLAGWMEIAKEWQYLLGTTKVQSILSKQNGCTSTCPSAAWTRDERSQELAYEFATISPKRRDPRGMTKRTRYSAVCVY